MNSLFKLYKKFDRIEEPQRMCIFLLIMSPFWIALFFSGFVQSIGFLYLGFVGITRIVYVTEADSKRDKNGK